MKAIWRGTLYRAMDTEGDDILLAEGDDVTRVSLGDPTLVIEPTDDEVREALLRAEARDLHLRDIT